MLSKMRGLLRTFSASKILVRPCAGRPGGIPQTCLPWRKGMDSPMRFTAWWLFWGILGFGAPFLVVRHQLLRNVTYPEEDKQEEETEEETGAKKKEEQDAKKEEQDAKKK